MLLPEFQVLLEIPYICGIIYMGGGKMTQIELNNIVQRLKSLIMVPIIFQDMSAELLDVKHVNHDSSWESPRHHHPWFEFNYIHDGMLYTTLGDTEFVAKSGQAFLIPPGCTHSHTHYKQSHDIGICLRWKLQHAPGSPVCYENCSSALSVPRTGAFSANMELLLEGDSYIDVQLSFVKWIINLFEKWSQDFPEFPTHENKVSNQVTMYLQEYYNQPINVENIAASLNMSYRNLSRNFKSETGITIIEKLNEIRIAEAKKLLISTNLPIYEIAALVGFENEYYFSNSFRRYAATTPSSFRKNNRL